jgi:hypothetical protein
MDESQQVSHLIGDIYDAALDRSLWPIGAGKDVRVCEWTNRRFAG